MNIESFQTWSQIAIAIGIILTALGGFGSYYFGKAVDQKKNSAAQTELDKLQSNIDELLEGNNELKEKLTPFEELAKKAHPGIDVEEALSRLRNNLIRVESKTGELEKRAAYRSLTSQQMSIIAASLRGSSPQSVSVSSIMGDQEGFQYAKLLKQAIENGGWNVNGVNQVIRSGPTVGLVISVGTNPPPKHVNDLYQALKAAGLSISGNIDSNLGSGRIDLIVGAKP